MTTPDIPKEAIIRRDHLIIHPDGTREDCKFINAAKRRSRALQKSGQLVRAMVSSPKEWNPPARHSHRQQFKKINPASIRTKPKAKLTEEQMSAAARRFAGKNAESTGGDR